MYVLTHIEKERINAFTHIILHLFAGLPRALWKCSTSGRSQPNDFYLLRNSLATKASRIAGLDYFYIYIQMIFYQCIYTYICICILYILYLQYNESVLRDARCRGRVSTFRRDNENGIIDVSDYLHIYSIEK